MKKKAVVLISGGMDSLVTLAIASKDYEIYALHADYRHRTEKKEHQAFEKICNYYKVKQKLIIDLSFFGKILSLIIAYILFFSSRKYLFSANSELFDAWMASASLT